MSKAQRLLSDGELEVVVASRVEAVLHTYFNVVVKGEVGVRVGLAHIGATHGAGV